jgi:hypothetical protein
MVLLQCNTFSNQSFKLKFKPKTPIQIYNANKSSEFKSLILLQITIQWVNKKMTFLEFENQFYVNEG